MASHPSNLIGRPFGGQLSVANEHSVEEFRWVLEKAYRELHLNSWFNLSILAKI